MNQTIRHQTIKRSTWHRESYDHTMIERLPALLAERLPLTDYRCEPIDDFTCRVTVTITSQQNGAVSVTYADLPQPNADGLFRVDGEDWVFVPYIEGNDLAANRVQCVGDWLYQYFEEHTGEAPEEVAWDEALLQAWLPLDRWVTQALATPLDGRFLFQRLDTTNWLARQTHYRRLFTPDRTLAIAPEHIGRVCPFELPEGPNLIRIQSIAVGATVADGRLNIVDESPAASLGLTASMIPCLEHNDPFNLLMGANMMRQWLPYADPEPALVQTGNEPAAPEFWCGRNLLTAFVPWGGDTFEDGIVLGETGAAKLSEKRPMEVGDKLSNRHGIKGVVSRIVPDAQMPCLADGTPVELIVNPMSKRVFSAFGQIREAVLGLVAHEQGEPVVVPSFEAPDDETIQTQLREIGLPADGQMLLHEQRGGDPMPQPVTVGYVYWGRTVHLARPKLQMSVDGVDGAQRQAEMEYRLLRQLGAVETIRGFFNTQAAARDVTLGEGEKLAHRLTLGPVDQAETSSPRFELLQRRLAAVGIQVTLQPLVGQAAETSTTNNSRAGQASPRIGGQGGERLHFGLTMPAGETIELAQPLPWPWLFDLPVERIGSFPALAEPTPRFPLPPGASSPVGDDVSSMPEFVALAEANTRLAQLLVNEMPQSLVDQAIDLLNSRLNDYLDALLSPADLRFDSRVLFSGRAVLAPGPELDHGQVGVPEEMAWTLFGPLVIRELENADAVHQRTPEAASKLEEILARSWVIVNRVPTTQPTSMIAFHPRRINEPVIRLTPLACRALDVDFDGDQVAVLLPVTEAGQREAGELLSIEAHLQRMPGLLVNFLPRSEALWGLAKSGIEVGDGKNDAPLHTALADTLAAKLGTEGVASVLAEIERLTSEGFELTRQIGPSLAPFIAVDRGQVPNSDEPEVWENYAAQFVERMIADAGISDQMSSLVLAVRCGAFGQAETLGRLLGAHGVVLDAADHPAIIRNGYCQGLTSDELLASAAAMRRRAYQVWLEWDRLSTPARDDIVSSFNVLARARRAERPGIVFARAAVNGERDKLVDDDSRHFVGL